MRKSRFEEKPKKCRKVFWPVNLSYRNHNRLSITMKMTNVHTHTHTERIEIARRNWLQSQNYYHHHIRRDDYGKLNFIFSLCMCLTDDFSVMFVCFCYFNTKNKQTKQNIHRRYLQQKTPLDHQFSSFCFH